MAEPLIDCDIHNQFPGLHALEPYLEDHWRAYINESAFVGPDCNDYPVGAPTSCRPDHRSETDDPPEHDFELLRQRTLDAWDLECGILTGSYWVQSVHDPQLAAALASALNNWQRDHWLEREPRLRASLLVPGQNPELAAREIDRLGGHPGFVQVLLPVRSHVPYGNQCHDPIFAAASRNDLVVGIHFGGASGNPPTPCGWPSTYLEEYAGMAQVFQSQVLSLIAEGAFDRFPQLRVALIEGGFTWMPSLMWRLDKEWKGLRRDTPWIKRPPSEYIREHFRLTLQPMDTPPAKEHLMQIIEQLDSEDLLMFSTDYPHWHFDGSEEALPSGLPQPLLSKIRAENARIFYRL